MKALIVATALVISFVSAANAQYYNSNSNRGYNSGGFGTYGTGSNPNSTYVQPHINNNGSYTGGHYRTNPNNTTLDNYGTRGNYNPYNGQTGRRNSW